MEQSKTPNKLISEKSPYLLQHAYNPVHWYPWGEEAFARARSEGKPIFLSIGYSTCHWCHVMERESFENEATAQILNEHFVPIKVDREERPDIDRIYMTALQAMGQNGGWPMSMFLTPELKPFYGGTYFPPESRQGRAGFPDVLRRIHVIWESERHKVEESAGDILGFLTDIAGRAPAAAVPQALLLDRCFEQFRGMYDEANGGFGGAPKFPRPVVFNFLLRYHVRSGNAHAVEMVERTIRTMAAGGIYDHVGGGFHRYAVDGSWRIPHFEKMLYDQAQIASTLADLYQLTHNDFYAALMNDILDYVGRHLSSPGGGFYSAEDADSPKPDHPEEWGEGAFYLWTAKDIRHIFDPEEAGIVMDYFGIRDEGNAPIDPQHEFAGMNILYVAMSAADVAHRHERSKENVVSALARARELLFAHRQSRPRPRLDDKILTSWNGLMISAFARAFQVTGNSAYLKRADRAAAFALGTLFDEKTGHLRRRYRDGQTGMEGTLDDYAFLVQALLDLYESSFDVSRLERAIALTDTQIELFWDERNGGFFDAPGTDPSVLVRLKEQYDGAEPAGNSVSALNLLRLAAMTSRQDYRGRADRILALSGELLDRQPTAMPQLAAVLDAATGPARQIVVAGHRDDPGTARLIQEVRQRFLPGTVVLLAEQGAMQAKLASWHPAINAMAMSGSSATAYVCQDFVCQLPITDAGVLGVLLERRAGVSG